MSLCARLGMNFDAGCDQRSFYKHHNKARGFGSRKLASQPNFSQPHVLMQLAKLALEGFCLLLNENNGRVAFTIAQPRHAGGLLVDHRSKRR